MHRCVLSYALPARARSVRLPVRTGISRLAWSLAARTWRAYSTAVEESTKKGSYQPFQWAEDEERGRRIDKAKEGEDGVPQPEDSSSDSDAALEFILQGYESQPEHFHRSNSQQKEKLGSAEVEAPASTSLSPLSSQQQVLDKRNTRTGRRARMPAQDHDRPLPLRKRAVIRAAQTTRKQPVRPQARPQVDHLWDVRPKEVSLLTRGPRGAAFRTSWNVRFARIQNQQDKRQHQNYLKEPPLLHPHTEAWVGKIRERLSAGHDLSLDTVVASRDIDSDRTWMEVALWCLQYDQELLLDFLLASIKGPNPPVVWIADCLPLLASHHARSTDKDTSHSVLKLIASFVKLATGLPSQNRVLMDGRFFRIMVPMCTDEQINTLYHALKTGNVYVRWTSHLHFASYFAKNEHFHQGLDAVLEAHRAGAKLHSPAFRSVCATLLRKSMEQPGGLRVCLRIVDNLVKIGLPLNTQLCNIIVLNAVEAGDLKTAFAIYHSLVEHRVHADKYTYAILLKGCKQDMGDTETLLSTIRAAIAATDVLESPVLATEILHCLTLHHTTHNRETAWPTICQAYAQLFDLQPLLDLGLPVPTSLRQIRPPPKVPLAPTPHALGIILHTHLSLLPATPSSTPYTLTLYSTYLDLLRHSPSTSPFAALRNSTHIPNAFLLHFTRHPRTLIHAARIIKDLQTHPPILPPPSVYSWTIFLHGFTTHGQMKLAEQVLTHMRAQGLEPNDVVWNSLIGGYAAGQDLEGLVEGVRRMERGGWVWSEFTRGNVGRFRNREGLEQKLGRRQEVKLDFTGELREGLERRIGGRGLEGDGGGLVEGREG